MKLVLIGINMNVADSAAADVSITFRKSNGMCLLGVVKQSELNHKHFNATQDYGDVINSESPRKHAFAALRWGLSLGFDTERPRLFTERTTLAAFPP